MWPLVSLMFGTLVSEDLACIAAGLLVHRGEIGAPAAIIACASGIWIGDIGLWGAGRLAGCAQKPWPQIARWADVGQGDELRDWLQRHAGRAVIASRFLPGSRLPLYVAAGLLRVPIAVFAGWSLLATLLWTPALVLFAATLGETATDRVAPVLGSSWPAHVITAAVVLLMLRALRRPGPVFWTRRV
jgi:membrane protein DedA with SNARE-associated domain